jgi:hypothetical protein
MAEDRAVFRQELANANANSGVAVEVSIENANSGVAAEVSIDATWFRSRAPWLSSL